MLRINFGSQINTTSQIEYEFNTLQCISDSKVTPKPYYCDGSKSLFPHGLLLMNFLEGRPLRYETDLSKAAYIFAQIHSLPINDIDPHNHIVEKKIFSDRIKEAHKLLAKVWDSKVISIEIKHMLSKILNFAQDNAHKEKYYLQNPIFCINNTEVNSQNFIIGEKTEKQNSYLVDWEKAVVTDPCQDLMHFLAKTTTLWKTDSVLGTDAQEFFFDEYEKQNQKFAHSNIRERIRLFEPYLYLRAISWCAYAYVEYHNPDKAIKNQDTFNKVKKYLDINFLETLFYTQLH